MQLKDFFLNLRPHRFLVNEDELRDWTPISCLDQNFEETCGSIKQIRPSCIEVL